MPKIAVFTALGHAPRSRRSTFWHQWRTRLWGTGLLCPCNGKLNTGGGSHTQLSPRRPEFVSRRPADFVSNRKPSVQDVSPNVTTAQVFPLFILLCRPSRFSPHLPSLIPSSFVSLLPPPIPSHHRLSQVRLISLMNLLDSRYEAIKTSKFIYKSGSSKKKTLTYSFPPVTHANSETLTWESHLSALPQGKWRRPWQTEHAPEFSNNQDILFPVCFLCSIQFSILAHTRDVTIDVANLL